jgi:putative ABC transport system permease protein
MAGIIIFTGLISGLFPALFISGFRPAQSLKAVRIPRSSANVLRKGLVVFQFVVAAFLLVSTVLVYQQMQLFRDKKLGFDQDQVAVIRFYGNFKNNVQRHPAIIKNEILNNPDIIAVGRSGNLIGDDLSVESVLPVGAPQDKEYPTIRVFRVDEHYIDVLGIKVKEGRNFSTAFKDSAAFILNQKAVQALGLKNPIGADIVNETVRVQGKVVGVVEDFHFATLHNEVEPLVLQYKPEWTGNLLVKIRAGKTASAISYLKNKVEKIAPGTLFSYGFLDDKIAGLYKKEDNMSNILAVFSVLAIIISCLGLFGLVAFAAEVRTREIGIRKVIGASVTNLVQMLSRDFIILVLIGNIIAWPLAWYAMHKWLQEFTYRINIQWQVFLLAGIATLVIAILTIGWHCLRSANANPVKSLRTE